MQLNLFDEEAIDDYVEAPATPTSCPGDVWTLGQHRLACGDAGDPDLVAALMQGEAADLCFTSPPYGNQRDYTTGRTQDWDAMMRSVFDLMPMTAGGQMLVNLGLVHRDNEVLLYWDGWLAWMRERGWRHFSWYVWDQGSGLPGSWVGRLAPSFEFIFHFNRRSRRPNKIVPCVSAARPRGTDASGGLRLPDGSVRDWSHAGRPTQNYKIPDAVIRVGRQTGPIGPDLSHPAVFPSALPEYIMRTYSDPGDLCYEPFCGSGSSLLAAQRIGRRCFATEIAPAYVDVALDRFRCAFPRVPVRLDQAAAAERLS